MPVQRETTAGDVLGGYLLLEDAAGRLELLQALVLLLELLFQVRQSCRSGSPRRLSQVGSGLGHLGFYAQGFELFLDALHVGDGVLLVLPFEL